MIDIHHYIHFVPQSPPAAPDPPDSRIGTMLTLLMFINERVLSMSGSVSDLTAQVAANTSVIASALVLINGFSARLAAAGTDPVALAALQAELVSSDTALAEAVAANTVEAPPAAPDPAP